MERLSDVDLDIAEGRLIELFAERADIYALYPDRKNLPARVRAFLDDLDETPARAVMNGSSVPEG